MQGPFLKCEMHLLRMFFLRNDFMPKLNAAVSGAIWLLLHFLFSGSIELVEFCRSLHFQHLIAPTPRPGSGRAAPIFFWTPLFSQKNTKLYKSIFSLIFIFRLDLGTLVAPARCFACRCFDLNAPDTPSMQPARVIIETPSATRMHIDGCPTITPDAAISKESRASSAIL